MHHYLKRFFYRSVTPGTFEKAICETAVMGIFFALIGFLWIVTPA